MKISIIVQQTVISSLSRCTCPLSWGCSRTGTADNIINPIMSAALRTPLSFSFTYGTIEVRAKMPAGDWIWPGEILVMREREYSQVQSEWQYFLSMNKSLRLYLLDCITCLYLTPSLQGRVGVSIKKFIICFYLLCFVLINSTFTLIDIKCHSPKHH